MSGIFKNDEIVREIVREINSIVGVGVVKLTRNAVAVRDMGWMVGGREMY